MFVTAVTGNYASYVSYHRAHASAGGSEEQAWYYDIDKVLDFSQVPVDLVPRLAPRAGPVAMWADACVEHEIITWVAIFQGPFLPGTASS